MVDTGFKVPADQQHRLADAYAFHPRDKKQDFDAGERSRWAKDRSFHSGGGGLASTLHDYHRFCLMLLGGRSEEHTSELQSLMRISYAVFCLKKKKTQSQYSHTSDNNTHH